MWGAETWLSRRAQASLVGLGSIPAPTNIYFSVCLVLEILATSDDGQINAVWQHHMAHHCWLPCSSLRHSMMISFCLVEAEYWVGAPQSLAYSLFLRENIQHALRDLSFSEQIGSNGPPHTFQLYQGCSCLLGQHEFKKC